MPAGAHEQAQRAGRHNGGGDLEKASTLFEEMDLQGDLQDLEKLRLHLDARVI